MRFDIITVLPGLLESPFAHSILQRAQKKGLAEIVVHNLRDYSTHKQKSVDDYPYGGGSGMVMMIEPFAQCIGALKAERAYDEVIFMTPDGVTLNQGIANELSIKQNLIILCGHYKGIDQRIRDLFVTREISVGDYVLSGGELPAAIVVDAVVRLIPGVLSDETSALSDSFQDDLLDAPVYTRPADWNGHRVPDILLSGHQARIDEWRHEQALERTRQRRPDLLK
ncbi:tRNA (guanosine(37)-N1)-methyltransferase TrmD [Pedobacter yulinensis]|uniref:tRNA (guanine-N(1)-)-methyltransferase n=1 Tax=Pedobacter yulinensis TaxID=2126353 RepID=A0A2T3HRK8_9SPHI|nr:tRNA (guanosine(37)-N1)-methyltransferase TrmD [Pedobacter yulinensis]PST85031.1 tRNA (guanosine(37)-N1)-methyltransferase TrmD [Pedobacter yulinensis]